MPLLGKEPFERKILPPNLSPEDEVYFCKATNEAFLTYDQFFERQILCSSMVWTCSITGKTGLTFEEALDSERNASDLLTAFPSGLQLPVLFLMNYMNESKFGSIVDMICAFISNRYFIGEEIETIITGKKRISGKVVAVIPPTDSEIINNEKQNKNKNSSQTLSFGEDPTLYKYEIIHDNNEVEIIGSERITRTKGLLTKDKLRLFLKQHLTAAKRFQPMVVKDSSKEELNFDNTEWTDLFSGPEPNFHDQTVIVKTFNKDKQKAIRDSKLNNSDRSDDSQASVSKRTSTQMSSSNSNLKKSGIKSVGSKKNSNSTGNKKSTDSTSAQRIVETVVTPEEKQRQREEAKMQRLEQKKLEKELRKQFEEDMKEWNSKRDDLACDDLVPLPNPITIKCQIPTELFGDTLVVLEFLHCFNHLFDLKAIFPFGITFELMEQILCDNDIHGPYGDLIRIMLTSILTLQEEEDKYNCNVDKDESSDEEVHNEEEKADKYVVIPDDKNANYYYWWIQQHLGQPLSQLIIDPFTVTEVLRLHLLSSGAGPKPRSKYRGLYHSREDPGIRFVLDNKEGILSKLENQSIYELNSEERIKIFQLLIHQMLAFVTFREHVDNAFHQISKLKRKIRDIQTAFSKWNKETKRNLTKKDVNTDSVNNEDNQMSESQTQSQSVATAEQLEEYQTEKSHKEGEMLKSCSDVRTQIRKLQECYNLKPIGFDRAFRRYWVFESLPGLFVEHLIPDISYTELPFGPCLEEPTPVKSCKPNSLDEIQLQKDISHKKDSSQRLMRDDSSTTSDKENEMNTSRDCGDKDVSDVLKSSYLRNLSEFDRCSANKESCSVHGLVNSDKRIKWAFYHTCEHLDDLISSLNSRGYRESELKLTLKQDKSSLIELMSKCQPNKLNEDIPMPEVRKSQRLQEQLHLRGNKTFYSQLFSNTALEKALKENLTNMEERIFAGSLGLVTKVSRNEWKEIVDRKSDNKTDILNNLSYAILVLAKTIRPLCLAHPLSQENGTFDRWSESLQQCSSLSQLFVHLSTLDHSIKWSKCAINAYCKICRRKGDADNMLLCDQCNRGHHTYCLIPSLDAIPRGSWLCPNCIPKFKPQSPQKQKTESIKSYESDSNTSDDEDLDNNNTNNNSDYSDENESVSVSNNSKEMNSSSSDESTPCKDYNICSFCKKFDPDLELYCAKCSDFYHTSCAKLKRITRSDWFCPKCSLNTKETKKRKQITLNININDSDDCSESESESKRTKRCSRYSQDFDYSDGERIEDEEEEKQPVVNVNRRRFDKSTAAFRKSLPLDFSLCDELLKKLQKHDDGWLFMSRPKNNVAPNYNKIIKKYVDFGQLVSKLNQGQYRTNIEFFNDILLMFTNCEFYWPKQTMEYKSGYNLSEYFRELLREYDVDLNHYSSNIYCD